MSGVKIVLLCEDKQTDVFVRRFLRHRNFDERDIRTLPLPDGRRSGEQWVRKRYPDELKVIRSRRDAYLIVVVDADTGTTEDRRKQLETECRHKGVPSKTERDPVLLFVPRRNVETWIAYLGGSNVDEDRLYPKLKRERDCAEHARQLHEMCRVEQRLREPAPPSLREACGEYRKLKR